MHMYMCVYPYAYFYSYIYIKDCFSTSKFITSQQRNFLASRWEHLPWQRIRSVTYLSPVDVVQAENLKLPLVSYMNVLTLRQFLGCYNFRLSCENSSALCK